MKQILFMLLLIVTSYSDDFEYDMDKSYTYNKFGDCIDTTNYFFQYLDTDIPIVVTKDRITIGPRGYNYKIIAIRNEINKKEYTDLSDSSIINIFKTTSRVNIVYQYVHGFIGYLDTKHMIVNCDGFTQLYNQLD